MQPQPSRVPIDFMVVLLISFALLLTSAIRGTFIAYPLLLTLILFITVLFRRGFALKTLLRMAVQGAHQALPVVKVLLLIGIITAIWMASGTVPALVYYGTGLISQHFFLLWAFVLTSAVSILLGTSFGTVGTIGIALMVIARGSGAAIEPVAGAIIAGAFLGDRCSPMSSSAHLVASITKTDLYTNLQNMVRSGLWPLALSVAFYAALSFIHPVQLTATPITATLPDFFDLRPIVLLPAVVILLLALLRVEVKLAMLVSIGIGSAIAHTIQTTSLITLCKFALLGYQLNQPTPLQEILLGGGLLPMAKATLVVFISTALAGIFSGSQSLHFLDGWLSHLRTRHQLAQGTVLVSLLSNLFGCTQTIGIVLTGQIMQPYYHNVLGTTARHLQTPQTQSTHLQSAPTTSCHTTSVPPSSNEQLALHIEDTAVVIAPLIPWNIAGLIPATILSVGIGFIPYTSYLILLPIFTLLSPRANRAHKTEPSISP